ncbi:MAG: HAD family hydrolase [Desulfobulbaceae bacterium]|nr:HAD family hydrolase [Desulfobulbaceae bacterium]
MKKKALLASDMDGTVIPLESGQDRDDEILQFKRLMEENPHVALAYVTGRHLELGLEGIQEYHLPYPDIFVCDVGTSIYFHSAEGWQKDKEYREELKKSWNGRTGPDIARLLEEISFLTSQEPEKQKEFKQSYYASRKIDADRIVKAIHAVLDEYALTANVIYSVDSKKDIGLVDVLPEIAAKDYALAYLCQKLALPKEKVVYAGDSGNDLLAFVSGFRAIVVANTDEGVKETVRRQSGEKGIAEMIFFASDKYVAGVMEGCYHFELLGKPALSRSGNFSKIQ